MVTEFTNETNESRYTMHRDGELLVALDYRIHDGSISLTSTVTVPEHRGNGYASELVQYAVDDIERAGNLRIVPACWYVAQWFDAHPERAGLLHDAAD